MKQYQKIWLANAEIIGRSRLPKLDFSINPGDEMMLEDPGKYGKIKILERL
jgi:hypothetical protein